tara:strand:- start:6888 stop:13412 length:6525 start_codon:yes stop_codon:yes gene_type:complete
MNKLCILLLILICILIVNNTKSFNKKVIKKGGNMIKNINNKTTYFTIKINKNQDEEEYKEPETNWFRSDKHFKKREEAQEYCKNNGTMLLESRKAKTGSNLGIDAWYENDFGYSHKLGEQTGVANAENPNGPAVCLNKKIYNRSFTSEGSIIIAEGINIKITEDKKKHKDVPDKNIWEIKLKEGKFKINNTLYKITLGYNIIQNITEMTNNVNTTIGEKKKIFEYDNKGYILELVKNKNIFNIYFNDTSNNNLGKIYLLLDKSGLNLIAKSEKQIKEENLIKTEFIIEPYKLNLFNDNNEIITHYENFVNNFNYEKFNLLFSLHFKHIIIPKIYNYKNSNKLTNNSEIYNIYPTNWIAGPNPEPSSGSELRFKDKTADIRYSNLYENENNLHLLISEPYKTTDVNITTKSKIVNNNESGALWRFIYNSNDKTYEIKNVKTNLSILQQVIENSKKFFTNYMNNKNITFKQNQDKKITLEEVENKPDYYNLTFTCTIDNKEVKMYLSTSNWSGILVARIADNTFRKNDKLLNAFVIKLNEEDNRVPDTILLRQQMLDLSDDDLNEIINNTVDKNKKIDEKYLKIEDNISKDYINNILYKKYYEKLEFDNKNTILENLEKNVNYLKEKMFNSELVEKKINNILENSPNIEKTIEYIQYIFNIKRYTQPKYYYSNPVGDILTIGNSKFNIHNFIIKIEEKMENEKKKYVLVIGFIKYLNNIEISLHNIKNNKNNFPSKINFKLEYNKPYLNVLVSYLKKNTDMEDTEEVSGYLDINGNIIKKQKEQKIEEFRKLTKDINFEIYFPAYINPWFSVGTIDNINVDTNLNKYDLMNNSFLDKIHTSNKKIENIRYNNKNEDGDLHILSTLQPTNKYNTITGLNNKIDFTNNDSLIFNIKLKKQNNTEENEDIENYLRYDKLYYIFNHYKVGEVQGREHTVMASCGFVHHKAHWCGGKHTGHNLDMYLLNSNYIKKDSHTSHFKFDPFNSDKEYLEYGDEVWIGYNHPKEKNQLLSCSGNGVYINFNHRTGEKTGNNWTDTTFENPTTGGFPDYKNGLIKIISPLGKTGKVLKKDKFILQFRNGYYLRINTLNRTTMGSGRSPNGCGDKLFAGVRADPNENIETQLWSIVETTTKLIDETTGNALSFDEYFKNEYSNLELFNIKGKNETLKIDLINNNLLIREYDIKYIKDKKFNESLEHINNVNTICDIPFPISIYENIIFDFVPMKNQYSLTIHNGNKFINYFVNIDLYEITRNTIINVSNNIELQYKLITHNPIVYIFDKIPINNKKEKIVEKIRTRKGTRIDYNFDISKNYFGTKIKNNFYKSNRIDNLYLRISSETEELTDKLDPQTILWNKTYNSVYSNDWNCDADCIEKMKTKKNKHLNIKKTPQTVIYEFNRPINITELRFNLDEDKKKTMKFEYFDEQENIYKKILEVPIIDNLKNTKKHLPNNEIVAYKFRFSTNNSEDPANIYNILMNGKIGRTFPHFSNRNIGIGHINNNNNKPKNRVFVNYITDKYGTWIKVGIFKANAMDSIKKDIKTFHNLSVAMEQDTMSAFSADFGEMEPSEVRILGAKNFNNWEETRTIDWIYKNTKTPIGNYRKWKNFFNNTHFGALASADYGFEIDGAYDGRGRWINDKLKHIRVSDYSYNNNSEAYNTSDKIIKFGDTSGDNQLYVNGNEEQMNGLYGVTSGFGEYDGNKYFFDMTYNNEEKPYYTMNYFNPIYYSKPSHFKRQKVDFDSAVWVLLKVNESDIEKINGSFNEVQTQLYKKRDSLIAEIINYKKQIADKNTLLQTKRSTLSSKNSSYQQKRGSIISRKSSNESYVYNYYLHRIIPLKSGDRAYLATQNWGAYNLSSQVYEKGPYYMRKFSQSPPPYEWRIYLGGSLTSGVKIKLQSVYNGKWLHSNTSHGQQISISTYTGSWSSWGFWKLTWSGSITSPWEKYSGVDVGKRVNLITGYGNANFGVSYGGGSWPLDRSYGWFLKWTTTLRIHMISTYYNWYSASNISEYGSFNFGTFHRGVGWNYGWIIEFSGLPRSGMEVFIKSAYNGSYIHSNRSGSWSLGGRSSSIAWTLNWSGTLTANTNIYIGMKATGGYLRNYSSPGSYGAKNHLSSWKILWENEGKEAYLLNKELSTLATQNTSSLNQLNAEIRNIPKEIKTLEDKIKKSEEELNKINEDLRNKLN